MSAAWNRIYKAMRYHW